MILVIKDTVKIDVELPDSCSGYRVVGIRVPQLDDYFYDQVSKSVGLCQIAIHEYPKIILEPIKKWRPVELSDIHTCLRIGPWRCQVTCGNRVVQGELHTARKMDDGGLFYFVQVDDSFGWYSQVEVLE